MNPTLTGLSDKPPASPAPRAGELRARLAQVQARIRAAEDAAGRPAGSVRLLAVSKGFGAGDVAALAHAGQGAFGESYLTEACDKIDTAPALEWHYIGRLQSGKLREIARRFAWVHSVETVEQARRLGAARPAGTSALEVCLQVNVDNDPRKAGAAPQQLRALAGAVVALPGIRLRGLMTVPALPEPGRDPRSPFLALAALARDLRRDGVALDTLSMGMSADLEAAVEAGASMVRIGTALFGAREAKR